MNLELFRPRAAARRCALAALALTAALAGCGGGQVDPFKAERVIVFGDEQSLVTDTGLKYSINATQDDPNSTTTPKAKVVDCLRAPVWVQEVADGFGLVFPQCNPNNVADPKSRIFAAEGAQTADIATQVDSFLQGSTFAANDLAVTMIGTYDIKAVYEAYDGTNRDALIEQIKERGKAWAAQINRVSNLGAKVLVVTPPNLGLSPYGLAEKAAHPGAVDRSDLISDLVDAFHTAVVLNIVNDGRRIGLVFGDQEIKTLVKNSGFGLSNRVDAACDPAKGGTLPNCTPETLVSGATLSSHLWADGIRPGATYQQRLGDIARSRAKNNPF